MVRFQDLRDGKQVNEFLGNPMNLLLEFWRVATFLEEFLEYSYKNSAFA